MLPWLIEAISTIAISTMVKYSQGLKVMAQRESGGDSRTRTTPAMSPPISEAPMPNASARSGCPACAIG